MEVEMMVISEDGQTTRTVPNHGDQRIRAKKMFNFFPLASICLTMAILALLIAASLFISTPTEKKPMKKTTKPIYRLQNDTEELVLRGIFNTNYGLENDSASLLIRNIDQITKQLNNYLQENLIQVTDAFFLKDSFSKEDQRVFCDNLLRGFLVQLDMIVQDTRSCISKDLDLCKKDLIEKIKTIFNQLQTINVQINLNNDRFEMIDMKICSLFDVKDTLVPANVSVVPSVILKKSRCSLSLGQIKRVEIVGEHGSRIYDDSSYQHYSTIILQEDSTYNLQIQFECEETTCELPQDINVWIDLNDNGLDDGESRMLNRGRINKKRQGNTFRLELYIPIVDGQQVQSGNHRMRLTATPSRKYQRECGRQENEQRREYTVDIIVKSTDLNVADTNSLCAQPIARISLVLMAGEQGTEIRDDQRSFIATLNQDDYDRHHLVVTIYEHTYYLMRIQLDCSWQLNVDQFENGCNLAQDVHVWIDGIENKAPYQWPVTSYMAQGIYDLQLYVPSLDHHYLNPGQHRIRVVITHNDQYRNSCGYQNYNETREYVANIVPRNRYMPNNEISTPRMILNNIICSNYVGKIIMVLMAGEHRTQIRDDSSPRALYNGDGQNQVHQTIVLFADTVYQLRIQLDCNRAWTRDSLEYSCSLVYDVDVWIDLNDDGAFDRSENVAPHRWPLYSYTPRGVYDLQLSIPQIGTTRSNNGPHRMQIVVTMNEQYRRKCGDDRYRETRDYTVLIVSRILQSNLDTKIPYLTLSDTVCSQRNGKIALVLMTGEQGTLIRDNIQLGRVLSDNQNRHHLGVTLYDNTIYRIRIQLDCFPHGKGGYPDHDCNVIQDVNVVIHFNNDHDFDENEHRIHQSWPRISSISLGIYDLDITIPSIDNRQLKSGSHRMQVILTPSTEYRQKCGETNYREVREYTVNIVPKMTDSYFEMKRSVYCLPTNLVCSSDYVGFAMIQIVGEEGSEIRDDMKACDSTNNYQDRTDQMVTLFAQKAYTIHIEFYYTQAWSEYFQSQYMGIWIDWNQDGVFDDNNERVFPTNNDETNQLSEQHNLQVVVPPMNGQNNIYPWQQQQHRMRIAILQNQINHHPCHMNGYGEARDYSIKVIS